MIFGLAGSLLAADSATKAMGTANYKESKGTMYAWAGFPGPCGDPSTALILLEKKGPSEVVIGDTYCYQIQVSNRSSVDVVGVTLEDTFPVGMAIESVEPKPSSDAGGKYTWDLGSIPAKSAKLITITGRAIQTGCLSSVARAKVCFELALPLVTRVVQCNIALTKTLPSVADVCDPIPMSITVQNCGSVVNTNVCIEDNLPDGLLTEDGKSSFKIAVGTLPIGASKTFNITLKATKTGDYTNTATVSADRNCYAQASASTKVVAPALELVATGPGDGYICTVLPYQITVTNKGSSPARDVVVTDTISGNKVKIEQVGENGKALRGDRAAWAIGTLQPGESRTVNICVSSTIEGQINSAFTVTAHCASPKTANHCLTLTGVPGVLTSLKDDCDPVQLNGLVTYTITATNTGSLASNNLRYTIKLDDGMEFVSGKGATAVSASGQTVTFAPLATLARGATVAWTVTAKATGVGDKRFTASLLTDELTSPVSKSESTNFYSSALTVVVAQ
jgi:uncharacterized repeat protein (TIGR01451 family)